MRTMHGLDESLYQCQYYGGRWHYPDFRKAAQHGVTWIKLRLAIGDYSIDPTFRGMYEGYKATGLYPDGVDPYIVWTPNRYAGGPLIPGAPQVDYALDAFLKMGFSLGETMDMRWTGDYELERGCTKGQIAPRVIAHLDRMNELLLKPVIYTRASWWDVYTSRGTGYGYPLHVAHYTGDYTVQPLIPADWKYGNADPAQMEYQYSADGNREGAKHGVLSLSIDKNVRFLYHADPPIPQPRRRARVIVNALSVRTGPSTNYPRTGVYLYLGDVVNVLSSTGINAPTEWVQHAAGWSCHHSPAARYMEEVE